MNDNILVEYRDGKISENDINNILLDTCEKFGFESLEAINTNQFSVCLRAVGSFINRLKALRDYRYNYFQYDSNKLNILCDYYIYICSIYNKRPYIEAFCYFTGINDIMFMECAPELKPTITGIRKRIQQADAQRVMNQATDSKQAILNIAYNNYVHSWNGQIKSNEIKTTVKTLDEIKQERLQGSAAGEQNDRFSFEITENNENM